MATDVLATDLLAPASEGIVWERIERQRSHRRLWKWAAVGLGVFAFAVGCIVDNAVHENASFDQARTSLAAVRGQLSSEAARLDRVGQELDGLNRQVGSASVALTQARSQLAGAQALLAGAQADVSSQTSLIADLHACLGGVEQAANALSVDDLTSAINALDAVSSSCHAIAGSDA